MSGSSNFPSRSSMRRIWSSDDAVCELRRQMVGGMALDLSEELGFDDPRPEAMLARLADLLAQAAVVSDSASLNYASELLGDLLFLIDDVTDFESLRLYGRISAMADMARSLAIAHEIARGVKR